MDAGVMRRLPRRLLRGLWRGLLRAASRGPVRVGLGATAIAVALPLALLAGRLAIDEYGFRPDMDAREWALRSAVFADAPTCGSCHARQYERLVSTRHAAIGCESCHGAQPAHIEIARAEPARARGLDVPTDALCLRCHLEVPGRPSSVRQIRVGDHYAASCLACHDPHTGRSQRPPRVEHTLVRLPPCVTCHGPEGFKARNQRHPLTPDGDTVCLACHAADRGRSEPAG